MNKKDSLLVGLRKFLEEDYNDKSPFSHMVIAMEISDTGVPIGTAIKMKCSPILALGMIDLVRQKLDESRNDVLTQLGEFEKDNMSIERDSTNIIANPFPNPFDKILKDSRVELTIEEKDFFNDCQKRALKALMAGDEEELDKITNELREYVEKRVNKKKSSDDSDEKGFDINDFKGNF
jgi:hypothetical protein